MQRYALNMFSEQVQSSRATQKEATRNKVLDTAYVLFVSVGYADTNVRAIAQKANVSVGTVMNVGSKQSLLIQTIGHRITVMHDELRGQSDNLLDVLAPFLKMFTGQEELSKAYGAALITQGDNGEILNELRTLLVDEIVLRLGNMLPKDDAKEFATILYNIYLGLLLGWAAGAYDTDELSIHANSSISRLKIAYGVK